MPLNKYRVFSKIAETGNMRKAAKEMMYTQQAVSRIVKCLEEEYGFALFIRERDGVKLTDYAEQLLPAVNKLIECEDKLLDIIYDIQGQEGLVKSVQIGACGSIVMDVVQSTLLELERTNPEIRVGVHYNANDLTTLKLLKSGDIDFAIMVEGCHGDMDFEPLFKEDHYAVVPLGHPLADEAEISLEDLIKYPNVITLDNPYYDEIMEDVNHHTVVVDEEIMMLPIIKKSNSVAIMSGIKQFSHSEELKVIPLKESHYRVLGIAKKPNDELSDISKLFIDSMKKILEQDE